VLREDKTARIEPVAVPVPRPGLRQRVSDWLNERPPPPVTEVNYEFSVGKYTFAGLLSDSWQFARIPPAHFAELTELQKVEPVPLMWNMQGMRWWWYMDRFYRESEALRAGEVHERVLRLRRAEDDRMRHREPAVAGVS
jgi:hypothetical protein